MNLYDNDDDTLGRVFLRLRKSHEPFVTAVGIVPVERAGLAADGEGVVVLASHVAGRDMLLGGTVRDGADHGFAEPVVRILAELPDVAAARSGVSVVASVKPQLASASP